MKNAARALAVIDGGKFDDVARLLLEAGLSGRPLYLEGGDPAARAAAGHLVPLYEARDLRAAIALGRGPGALVIWSWPKGEMALYRHLRTLNLVKIPNEARAEAEAEGEGEDVSGMPAYETVLFRHWDPNVLGTLLPLLEGPQQARFLGAAGGLAFDATDIGRMVAAPRPSGLPPPTPGMLQFSEGQLEAFVERRDDDFHRKIMLYLRDAAPEYLEEHDDAALYAVVSEAVASGDALGLESEYSHGLWAYLHVITDGETTRSKEIRRHFYNAKDDPEKVLEALIADVQAELDQG
jgi:hypothetical protein